jgi:hypothetical protein
MSIVWLDVFWGGESQPGKRFVSFVRAREWTGCKVETSYPTLVDLLGICIDEQY